MKKSVIMVLALTALFGCSKMEQEVGVDVNGNPVGEVPVKLTGVIEGTASTRGAGVINGTNPSADLDLDIFRANSNSSGAYPDGVYGWKLDATMAATTGAISFPANQKQYWADDVNIKGSFIALYPKTTVSNWTYAAATRTITGTLDGSTDVMTSQVVEGDNTTSALTLTLKHVLTKIGVRVQAKQGESHSGVQSKWGKVTKIEIISQPNTVTLTLPTPVANGVSSTASLTTDVTTADFALTTATGTAAAALAIPASDDPATFGYAMLVPVGSAGITLRFYTENLSGSTPNYKDASVAQAFAKGFAYVITVSFSTSGSPEITDVSGASGLDDWDNTPSGIAKDLS